jgi:iron-sulfur cluster repair protein YtfE (RIC family)
MLMFQSVLATSLLYGALAMPAATASSRAVEGQMGSSRAAIPESIKIEHEAIHSTLVEATKASGRVGIAARELAEVLHPHFVREEEIALPPLGLLAPLAAGGTIPATALSEALAMTDALKSELPRMLEEHTRIRAAVEALRAAAVAEKAERYERLAQELALHARTEEQVLYPAAVLVGELIRGRQEAK